MVILTWFFTYEAARRKFRAVQPRLYLRGRLPQGKLSEGKELFGRWVVAVEEARSVRLGASSECKGRVWPSTLTSDSGLSNMSGRKGCASSKPSRSHREQITRLLSSFQLVC